MKKIILISGLMILSIISAMSQEKTNQIFPMIGEKAPSFRAESTTGTLNFPGDYGKQWKILFSHPADFTPVCTSEILELAASQDEFKKLGSDIVVVSVDALENHIQWEKSMETIKYKGREPVKIGFPLVPDTKLEISRQYGMIHPSTSTTKDVRGVFIIDPENVIRAIFFYPMSIGRNLGEIERTLVALQTSDRLNVLTPANWQPGGDVLMPYGPADNSAEQLAPGNDPEYYQPVWYMRFRKVSK